jgi:hypothetical protein
MRSFAMFDMIQKGGRQRMGTGSSGENDEEEVKTETVRKERSG